MTTFSHASLQGRVHPQSDEGPYRFERRQVDRWPAHGAATAFCLGGDSFGRIVELSLLDYSHDGMAALAAESIAPGTEMSVGFASPGHLARRCTVLRCEPRGEGYRIAMQFQMRLAA